MAEQWARALGWDARRSAVRAEELGTGHITFFFMDGVEDTYHVTDCDMSHIRQICKELKEKGIPVKERM